MKQTLSLITCLLLLNATCNASEADQQKEIMSTSSFYKDEKALYPWSIKTNVKASSDNLRDAQIFAFELPLRLAQVYKQEDLPLLSDGPDTPSNIVRILRNRLMTVLKNIEQKHSPATKKKPDKITHIQTLQILFKSSIPAEDFVRKRTLFISIEGDRDPDQPKTFLPLYHMCGT